VRCRCAIAVVAFAGSLSTLAAAAGTPKGTELEAKAFLVQAGAPGLGFFPTRAPLHYVFESYSVTGSPPGLDLAFSDTRFIANPTEMREHEITFDTSFLNKRSCVDGATKHLHVGGTTIYDAGHLVWRCVTIAGGRLVRESASGPASAATLAVLVAYARRDG
jgi:hypothetical protein